MLIESTLKISYSVKNIDNKLIYFSIGAHPGFNCELGDIIEFEKPETVETYLMNKDGYLFSKEIVLDNCNQICLQGDTFKKDALMMERLNSRFVTLKRNNYQIKLNFYDAPYLGLWSKPSAPFVCIEPWFGINDWQQANYDFKNKPGVVELDVDATFYYEYTIEII